MIRDLFVPEDWERTNDHFRSQLKTPPDQGIKFFRGIGHAVYETAIGTSQLYSHKRGVGFIKGNTPYIDFILPYYLREAYQVQSMDLSSLKNHHASWSEWVQTLKKDTVLVIASEDHPVTGELQDLTELDQALNEKKIFFLRISHSSHVFRPLVLNPYTLRICSLSSDLCFVQMGAKFKTPPVLAQVMNWSSKEIQTAFRALENKKEFPKEISKFETEMKDFIYPWNKNDRLYDRSLLVFPEVTGDLMTQTLSQALGFSAVTNQGLHLWSTHLCQWNSIKMFKSWWKDAPSEEILRDLLILSPELIQRNGFAEILRKTYEELKVSQTWNF